MATNSTRVLGASGIEVSPIGMGCMGITHASGDPLPDAQAIEVIRQAHEMGYTFFDTAECYQGVRPDGSIAYNEEVVGKALASVRDQVVIATKFGVSHGADKVIHTDRRPDTIRASIEGSLQRLRTDYIDLYYQHRIDPRVAPEEVAGVMADLMDEGLIHAWGISEANEEYLRRAHAVCPVSAIQNRYSMMALLADLAQKHHATTGQISLAWMLCKKPYIIPIPGSRKPHRLKENFDTQTIMLSSEEIAQIDKLLDGLDLKVFGGHAVD